MHWHCITENLLNKKAEAVGDEISAGVPEVI